MQLSQRLVINYLTANVEIKRKLNMVWGRKVKYNESK